MKQMLFASTNKTAPEVPLAEAIVQGQAPDKGLYLPVFIPRFAPGELASFRGKPYPEIAAAVLEKYTEGTFSPEMLNGMCRRAYDFDVPIEEVDSNRYVMRLDRGPTASFKDFAGRMMGRMLEAIRRNASNRLVILTATSGDTGSAVAHAFYKIPNVEVMVLFPPQEVSARQRKQMTTLGENITAVGVDGKFDDCQALVKQAFTDDSLRHHIDLTSANSINVGRLLPQIVYYVYAYVRLAHNGDRIIFSVPSGNFGNMMGALLAGRMGVPVERIVVSTNANDEVPRFLETGRYEKIVPSRCCLSNAMNVGHPSNLARVVALFDGWMDETGLLRKTPDMARMRNELWAAGIDDLETRATIIKAWQRHHLLLEPHGAVGWLGLKRYLNRHPSSSKAVLVETAHPAKFPEEIEKLLGFSPEIPPGLADIEKKQERCLSMPADYGAFRKLLRDHYSF
ncbi:MAG TPA: threonine synthase [Acidobacteriota bacterium]|nr:threonine synthase [Acidobacteriota bacterium]